jgi:radical SAM superfamily enzyme YgiQ (UPF0313 family)
MGVLMEKTGSPVYPPMDLVYAATVLRALGVTTHLVDSLGRELPVDQVVALEPDVVAVRVAFPTVVTDLHWASELKRAAPGIAVVAFGALVQQTPDEILAHPSVDALALGEAEVSLAALALGGELHTIPGIMTSSDSPRSAPSVANLDGLPFPDWSLLPVEQYTLAEIGTPRPGAYPVLASRGCPHGCAYCSYPVAQGRKLRTRSVDDVLREVELLVSERGARHLLFRDPCFGMDRGWMELLCRGLIAGGHDLTWRCETRPEALAGGMVDLMAEAGLREVNLGVESTDPGVLEEVGRRTRLDDASEVIRRCRELGIDAWVFLIAGLPGDSPEGLRRTAEWVSALHPASVEVFPLTLYPGTPLHGAAEQQGTVLRAVEDVWRRGRTYAPSTWTMDDAGSLVETRRWLALEHARWLRSLDEKSSSPDEHTVSGGSPRASVDERLRAYLNAARIARAEQRLPEALHWLESAARTGVRDGRVLLERGKIRVALGDRAAALRDFRNAVEASGRGQRAVLRLARHLAEDGTWDDAVPLLNELLTREDLLPSRRALIHRLLAVVHERTGDHEAALCHRQRWRAHAERSLGLASNGQNPPLSE